jgi:hypothetical protein
MVIMQRTCSRRDDVATRAGVGTVFEFRQQEEMPMRKLVEFEHHEVAGGDDPLPPAAPPQSRSEIQAILDQLKHLDGRPGTY